MKKYVRLLGLIVIVTICLANSLMVLGAENKDLGSWETKANMLTERYSLGVETVGEKIYAIGGRKSSGDSSTLEEYDSITDTWIIKTPMSQVRYGIGTAVVDDKLYVMGGQHLGKYKNTVEEYNPITDTWTAKANMPTGRFNFATCVVNGKIYAIGGFNSTGRLNIVEEYDPATDTWTTKANMPTPRAELVAVELNGKIYALGGRNNNGIQSVVEQYNVNTNTWTSITTMTEGKYEFGAAVTDEKIYIFGGNNGNITDTVEEYNTVTGKWTTLVKMPTARSRVGVTQLDGKMYVIGGINSNSLCLNDTIVFAPTSQEVAPLNLKATPGNYQIVLNWDAVPDADSYVILRSTNSDTIDTVIASDITTTTYIDNNVEPGVTYYYVVRAEKNGVESADSNIASAMIEENNNRALLLIKLIDENDKEYDLSMNDVDAFMNWYYDRGEGQGPAYYVFKKNFNVGPYVSRKEYITYDKIICIEVNEYEQ